MPSVIFGGTNFPTTLDAYGHVADFVDDVTADNMNSVTDAIEALEAKVGVDGSAVATSLDYILKRGRHSSTQTGGGAGSVAYVFDTANAHSALDTLASFRSATAERARIGGGGATDTYLQIGPGQVAAVSPANTMRLRYDDVTHEAQVSLNGGAWSALATAAAQTLQVAYDAGEQIILDAQGAIDVSRGALIGTGEPALVLTDANLSPTRTVTTPLLRLDDDNDGTGATLRIERSLNPLRATAVGGDDRTPAIELISTVNALSGGPEIHFFVDTTADAGDSVGFLKMFHRNSVGAKRLYAEIAGVATAVTDAAELGAFEFWNQSPGNGLIRTLRLTTSSLQQAVFRSDAPDNASGAFLLMAIANYAVGNPVLRVLDTDGAGELFVVYGGGNVVAGNNVQAAAGAAATPSVTFTGFATTGLFAAAGPVLGVAVNGAEAARFQAGALRFPELAAVPAAPGAAFGTYWVRNDVPSAPVFTDDTGVDHVLAYAAGLTLQTAYDAGNTITTDATGRVEITRGALTVDADYALYVHDDNGNPGRTGSMVLFVDDNVGATGPAFTVQRSTTGGPGVRISDSYVNPTPALQGPTVEMYAAKAAVGADDDGLGRIEFYGPNQAGTKTAYAALAASIRESNSGVNTEGYLDFFTFVQGNRERLFSMHAASAGVTESGVVITCRTNVTEVDFTFRTIHDHADGTVMALFADTNEVNDRAVGQLRFEGNNNAGVAERTVYASIRGIQLDVTDGSEDGSVDVYTITAGSSALPSLRIQNGGLRLTEKAAVPIAAVATYGTFWVRSDTPNVPMFTDDGGTDRQLAYAGTGVGTLDQAYDFGGAGAGRTITADSGAVVINNAVNDATNTLELSRTVGTGAALSIVGPTTTTGNITKTGDATFTLTSNKALGGAAAFILTTAGINFGATDPILEINDTATLFQFFGTGNFAAQGGVSAATGFSVGATQVISTSTAITAYAASSLRAAADTLGWQIYNASAAPTNAATQTASPHIEFDAQTWTGAAAAVRNFDIYAGVRTDADEGSVIVSRLNVTYEGYNLLGLLPSTNAPVATPGLILRNEAAAGTYAFIFRAAANYGAGFGTFAWQDNDGAATLMVLDGAGRLTLTDALRVPDGSGAAVTVGADDTTGIYFTGAGASHATVIRAASGTAVSVAQFGIDFSGPLTVNSITDRSGGGATFALTGTAQATDNVAAITLTGGTWVSTSGTRPGIRTDVIFAPPSGTAVFYGTQLRVTVNQTGGANGTVSAHRIEVTETAIGGTVYLADWCSGTVTPVQKFAVDRLGNVYATSNADAAVGPELQLYHDDPSADASDDVGVVGFYGETDTSAKTRYSYISGYIVDPANANRHGGLRLIGRFGGTEYPMLVSNVSGHTFSVSGLETFTVIDDSTYIKYANDATPGPSLVLDHTRPGGNGVDNDEAGAIIFRAEDDGGTLTSFAQIKAIAAETSAIAETGYLSFTCIDAGTFVEAFRMYGTGTAGAGIFHSAADSHATLGTTRHFTFQVVENSADGGPVLSLFRNRTNAAGASNVLGVLQFDGMDDQATPIKTIYGQFYCQADDPANGSEDGRFVWNLIEAGTSNEAMRLLSTGVLQVDLAGTGSAAQVDLFDDFDDAMVLRDHVFPVSRQRSQESIDKLVAMGVVSPKSRGAGYMLGVQPLLALIGGAAYQTRDRVDRLTAESEALRAQVLELRQENAVLRQQLEHHRDRIAQLEAA